MSYGVQEGSADITSIESGPIDVIRSTVGASSDHRRVVRVRFFVHNNAHPVIIITYNVRWFKNVALSDNYRFPEDPLIKTNSIVIYLLLLLDGLNLSDITIEKL